MMLCLVAIFKNESEIIEEWLNHYINEGVDHFFLIDNDSDDDYEQKLAKYNNVTLIKDNEKYAQAKLYNKYFLEKVKSYDWTIVCDLDEFIYARLNYKTISEYLSSVDKKVSQIAIPWKIFGSNGFNTVDKKEPSSAIQNFTKRLNFDRNGGLLGIPLENNFRVVHCKCIVRSSSLEKLDIHNHKIRAGFSIQSTKIPMKHNHKSSFARVKEHVLEDSSLHINHYAIRSFDWFTRVKMTRGSANSLEATKSKSRLGYFWAFDKVSNDIEDFELCHKKYD